MSEEAARDPREVAQRRVRGIATLVGQVKRRRGLFYRMATRPPLRGRLATKANVR